MTTISSAIVAGVAVLLAQVAPVASSIGLASTEPGAACLALSGPALAPGAIVTLVEPRADAQATLTAVVEDGVPTCRLETHLIDGTYYRIRPRTAVGDSLQIWVAFRGELAMARAPGGGVAVRVSAAYPDVQVRLCTSREGVHYTVWSGEPLASRRLWSQYFYLGYDTEPSCVARDVDPRFAR